MGVPQNSRLFKYFFGVGTPKHGVLGGLLSSEWRTIFFQHLRPKKPRPNFFFIFSNFDPRAELCPLRKWSNFWRFLKKISRKIEGAKYKGASCTQRISVVDPTLRWGRFSPPFPNFLGEVKQIFEISATLGLRTAKTLRCIRTKFSGFVDIRQVNKSSYFYDTP